MPEPDCLMLAKKLVRLMERSDTVAFMEKKRALVIAGQLFESGHYAPGSGAFHEIDGSQEKTDDSSQGDPLGV